MNVTELLDRMVSLVYPPRCVLCSDVVEYGNLLCEKCTVPLDPLVVWDPEPAIRCLLSPLPYDDNVRSSILGLKELGEERVAQFHAGQMHALAGQHWTVSFDAIVPVPPRPRKRKRLGFHHAQLLAEALGKRMGVPVENGILLRKDSEQAHHTFSAQERRENARRSYDLRQEGAHLARGKRLLLLDDIKTTGATLSACAGRLLEAGAGEVYAITACHTIDDPNYKQDPGSAR